MKIDYSKLLDTSKLKIENNITQIDEIIEYEEILLSISNSIIEYRKEHDLTQNELAKKLGVKQVMISKLERGNYNPTFKLIHNISRKLVSSADFFCDILNNIVSSINEIYTANYYSEVKDKLKGLIIESKQNKQHNDLYIMKINDNNMEGNNYVTKDCTSSLSIAG
jgi:DNA-binding XRE family transcriptional regulator